MDRKRVKLPDEEIGSLYKAGNSAYYIASTYGVSHQTICRWLEKHSIERRHTCWNKGLTAQIDERLKYKVCSRFANYHHSLETREKISLSHKGLKHNLETRNKISLSQKGRGKGIKLSDSTKQKMSQSCLKLWENPARRARQSAAMRERWADPVFSSIASAHMRQGNIKKPTKPEQRVSDILIKYKLPFRYSGDGSFMIGKLNPDFVSTNIKRAVIEVFGDYWHGERGEQAWHRTELGRIMAYNSYGYKSTILWEGEMGHLTDEEIAWRIKR